MSDEDDDEDYKVGYGRPPKKSQFRKGQSGNPKGRPKGAKGFAATMQRQLARKVPVRQGNQTVWMTVEEALSSRALELASKGNIAALRLVFGMEREFSERAVYASGGAAEPPIPDEIDEAIMQHFSALIAQGLPLPGASMTNDGPDQESGNDEA